MITTTEKRFDNAQEIIKYIDTLKAKREKKLQKKSYMSVLVLVVQPVARGRCMQNLLM